jgi:hypothetical protein
VRIDRPDEGDAPPISRGRGDQPAVEPPLEPRDSTVMLETRDRKTYEAELRRAVDAEYETARAAGLGRLREEIVSRRR